VYERYYGLRELPFELTPNPRYLYLTERHREALSNLQYGIVGRRGVTLLIGEAGTGKTTLVRSVLESERQRQTCCVYLNNPALTRSEFIEFLARAFGLSGRAAASKASLLYELERVLLERHARGVVTALLVDEAQALSFELLEEVRLLANIETPDTKLLPVVLAGQPQLSEVLNHPDLRQLKQRVALRCELRPLDLTDTAAYIAGRVRIAGGDASTLFTREAIEVIHQGSRGIPRTISVICDNALVTGFASDRRPIGRDIAYEVCRDFDLAPAPPPSRPPARLEAPRGSRAKDAPGRRPPAAREPAPARETSFARETPPSTVESMFSLFNRRRRFSFF
jgi:general secretion pathway protein A